MKIGRWILLAMVLAGGAGLGWHRYGRAAVLPGVPGDVDAPESMVPPGVRIKVEVLNATGVRGLARRATQYLRDRGFDVVDSGTSSEQRQTTLVLDRSAHPEWAQLVGKAMKAPVEQRTDSSRYLDVTVLIGADWRPPPLPFYP